MRGGGNVDGPLRRWASKGDHHIVTDDGATIRFSRVPDGY